MKITKLVAVSLTAAFAFGCNDSSSTDTIEEVEVIEEIEEVNEEIEELTENSGNSIALTDSATDDTGKVTYTLDNVLDSGSVSLNVKYAAGETETAYLALYDATLSSDNIIANVKMDADNASDGLVGIKLATSTSSADDYLTTATFAEDTWITITIIWTSTSYTLSVDGTEIGTWPVINENAVSAIQVKLGNDNNTTDYTFYIDDLEIYSDTVASIEVLSENFDDRTVGDDVSTFNNYTQSTNEAVITDVTDGTETSAEDSVNESFPITLDEFNFNSGSYANSGSATISLTDSGSIISNTIGAAGINDTALNLAQDTNSGDYGYLYYTNTSSAGADKITGSFSTEIVMQLSTDETYSSDVSLIDYVNTDYYIGFKTYLEQSDHSVKFKVYGGATDLGVAGLSSEAKTDTSLVSNTWYHIVSVYNADDTSSVAGVYGSLTIYINGYESATKAVDFIPVDNEASVALDESNVPEVNGVATEDKFYIAGSSSSDNKNINGDVDNVATWNVALTAEQVLTRAATFELY